MSFLGTADWHSNGIQTKIQMTKSSQPKNSRKFPKPMKCFVMVIFHDFTNYFVQYLFLTFSQFLRAKTACV